MNEQKILDVLDFIRTICVGNTCENCQLSDDNRNCILQNCEPCDWKLNNRLPKKWSAFRFEDME